MSKDALMLANEAIDTAIEREGHVKSIMMSEEAKRNIDAVFREYGVLGGLDLNMKALKSFKQKDPVLIITSPNLKGYVMAIQS